MVRLLLPVSLLPKHSLRIHKCFGDAVLRLNIGLCNETRYQPWARVLMLIFSLLIGNINYYYQFMLTKYRGKLGNQQKPSV